MNETIAALSRTPATDSGGRADCSASLASFRLPRDYDIRLPDSAAFIAGAFQAFVGDFRPKLF
jgi:hypothetical protein